jgi:hypothetical protein
MYFYFKKMKDTKYVLFLEKRKKKQDINVVLLIKMYNNFVNFLCPWRSVDTVGMGMEEEISPRGWGWRKKCHRSGNGARSGKIPSAQSPPR